MNVNRVTISFTFTTHSVQSPSHSVAVPTAPVDSEGLGASLSVSADAEDPGTRPLRELPLPVTQAECPLSLRLLQEIVSNMPG